MLRLLLRKWWLILLQGILLIIASIYIFNNPVQVLAGISFWFGILVLVAGLLGVIGWVVADKEERESMSVLWSILTVVFGLLMLLNLSSAMKSLTVIFGLWVLITGIHLTQSGWSFKNKNSLGWVMLVVGVLSVITAVMMIFNMGTGAVGISTLLGLQVLFAGIALVVLSFLKKAIVGKVKNKIETFKSGI